MPQPLGTKTVGDVITWITEQFGDVANVQIDSPKIIRWINMAILEICTRDPLAYQGKFTTSTVANQGEYTYPENLLSARMVKWANRPLKPVNFELIQQMTEDAFIEETGDPMYWTQHANTYQLWPVPDSVKTITIYASAKPANVTVSGDTLPLSDKFFPRIIEYVDSCAKELDEDYESASAKRTQFEDMMKLGQNEEELYRGFNPVMTDPDYEEWDYAV